MTIREEAAKVLSFLSDKEKVQFGVGCYIAGTKCEALKKLRGEK